MLKYMLNRLVVAISVAFTVSILSFILLNTVGDLAQSIAGAEATAEQVEQVRIEHGLDKPLIQQYFQWLSGAIILDFGNSFYFPSSVYDLLKERLPVTITLGLSALSLALLLAIPLGVIAAIYKDTWIDRLALTIAVLGQAMPSFWFGLSLIIIFAYTLQWFPISGAGDLTWRNFVLPAVALSYYALPALMRLTRAGMIDALQSDYIRTARAKGLVTTVVVAKHALRNALIPVVALAAVELGFMLGGSLVIESVFSLNGIGLLAWQSIERNDFPVVQTVVLLVAFFYIVLTFFADLLNAVLDPRIRTR